MSRTDATRVVVTGMGVMSGLGDDLPTFWDGLVHGRSCVRLWDRDPRIAAKVGGAYGPFSLDTWLGRAPPLAPERIVTLRRLLRGAGLWEQLTACAALQAFDDAQAEGALDPDRFAHLCAGQNLSLSYYADNVVPFREHPDDIEPLLGMIAVDTDVVGLVCELLKLRGPSALIGGACASGNLAILNGVDLIRSGRADSVLVTGAPCPTHPMLLHALTTIEAISHRSFNDAPERASRPFDALREGFVPSEGAAAVVLESLASARARGVPVRAEILGGASTSDGCRLPKPHLDGQLRAIRGCLTDADIGPDDVDYVNAHATSTPLGDAVEVAALKAALGARAHRIPVNSTKSMIGHGVTSAAVLELVAIVLQLEQGVVHPTINQERPDPELDLDFVPNRARTHPFGTALSNAFGFGGINSCVAVGSVR